MAINQPALRDGMREVRYRVSRAFPGRMFTLELKNWGQSVAIRLGELSAEVAYDPMSDDATNVKWVLEACEKLVARASAQESAASAPARRRAFRAKQAGMRAKRLVVAGLRRRLSRSLQVNP